MDNIEKLKEEMKSKVELAKNLVEDTKELKEKLSDNGYDVSVDDKGKVVFTKIVKNKIGFIQ